MGTSLAIHLLLSVEFDLKFCAILGYCIVSEALMYFQSVCPVTVHEYCINNLR